MYNHYIPQSDGSYRRSAQPEPRRPSPPPKPKPEPPVECPPEPPRPVPPPPPPCPPQTGILDFLKGLLPRSIHGGPDDRVSAPADEQGRRRRPEPGADAGPVLPFIETVGRAAPPTPTAFDDRARNKSARHCEPVRAWQSPGASLQPVRISGRLPRRFAPRNDVVTYGCSS